MDYTPSAADKLPVFVKYGRIDSFSSPASVLPILRDRDVEVFEKVDGGNCQVRLADSFRLLGGSKANFLKGKLSKVRWFPKFLKWMYSNHSLYNLPSNIILFGEWSGNHTINYGKNNDRFFMLDILDLSSGRFLPYDESKRLVNERGIEGVSKLETLWKGNIDLETMEGILEDESGYYGGPREGLVIKDYLSSPQEFFKIYNPDFADGYPVSDSGNGVMARIGLPSNIRTYEDYLTPARFRNVAFSLFDELGRILISPDELALVVRDNIRDEKGVKYTPARVAERLRKLLASGRLPEIKEFLE